MASRTDTPRPSPTQTGGSGGEDRFAGVGKVIVELAREAQDWRHNGYTRVYLAELHDRLSALAATPNPIEPRAGVGREEVEKVLADAMTPYLPYLVKHMKSGAMPMVDDKFIGWSDWLARRLADAIIALFAGAGE